VHVIAAAVWVGGLVGLARRWSGGPEARRWDVAARYSTVAMIAATVVVASGIVQSLRQLDTWSEVTGTDFGATLLVKVALVVALLVLAAVSRRSVASQHGRLGRTVSAELAATVLILGATGFLAGASPVEADRGETLQQPGGRQEDVPDLVVVEVGQGDRVATIDVSPARAGPNVIDVSVFNRVDRGELPDEIAIEMAAADGTVGTIEVALEPVSRSRVIASDAPFTFPGEWIITIRARYGEFESVAFAATVTIAA
jgi:copper transport protein